MFISESYFESRMKSEFFYALGTFDFQGGWSGNLISFNEGKPK